MKRLIDQEQLLRGVHFPSYGNVKKFSTRAEVVLTALLKKKSKNSFQRTINNLEFEALNNCLIINPFEESVGGVAPF